MYPAAATTTRRAQTCIAVKCRSLHRHWADHWNAVKERRAALYPRGEASRSNLDCLRRQCTTGSSRIFIRSAGMRHSPESKLISDHSAHRSGQCLRLQRQPLFRDLFERLSLRNLLGFSLGTWINAIRNQPPRFIATCTRLLQRHFPDRHQARCRASFRDDDISVTAGEQFQRLLSSLRRANLDFSKRHFPVTPTGGEPSSYSQSYPRARQAVNGQPKSVMERKSLF